MKQKQDMALEDIWSAPDDMSEAEKAARRLEELLRKWSAIGSLQSLRYSANRPVSRSTRA